MTLTRLVFVFLAFSLSSTAFAVSKLEIKEKDGSWRAVGFQASYEQVRETAKEFCDGGKPMRIVDTETGKIEPFDCGAKPVAALSDSEVTQLVQRTKDLCKLNHVMETHIDCECLEEGARAELKKSAPDQLRGAFSDATLLDKLTKPVREECIKREAVYEYNYQPCVRVLRRQHPNTYDAICSCVGNSMTQAFLKERMFGMGFFSRHHNTAFKQCLASEN